MGFFRNLFGNSKPVQSVVVIDVGARSVAGAYVHYREGGKSTLVYSERLPIEARSGELQQHAMLHTLHTLGAALIREGAPALSRAISRGTADSILVSVDTPWQEVHMRIKHITERDPFIFTRELAALALEEIPASVSGRLSVDESTVGTELNGYGTRDPYGKSATRASITTLASYIDQSVAEDIAGILRALFHTENISLIAARSLRYQAMRAAFTHEHNACIVDAIASPISLSLVHKDIPVSITEAKDVATAVDEIKSLAKRFSLPKTIFLLASESEDESLRHTLEDVSSPTIVSVRPSHVMGLVTHTAPTPPDMSLLLMALYPQIAHY